MTREREAKLPVEAPDARRRLEEAGAAPLRPRHLEENWLLDSPDRDLARTGRILRLRRAGERWTVTLKGPGLERERHKIREERETGVENGETLLYALPLAGLRVTWRYQKRRTTWRLGPVTVALDETPIGDYLELEGEEGETEAVARRLGYDPGDFLAETYADLHRRHLEERGLPVGDMLFAGGTEGKGPGRNTGR